MPSLIRLLFVLGLLGGLAYGAVVLLATFVEPKPREITVTIPQDRLNKPR
jgi:phage shock protein PspC (stress-responsive transcriptional regulator)